MTTLFEYMLKISACYAAMYLFYRLVLRHLTSYRSNRFYLLFSALLAFVIPLLKPDLFLNPQTISNSGFISQIPALDIRATANEYIPAESSGNILRIITTILIGGVTICLAHFAVQLLSFRKFTAKANLINVSSAVKLYHLDVDIMPFSFGNAVYVNRHKHTAAELEDIIKHESVHVHQQHTIDVIIAELVCIFNWYNPFAWLVKNSIKQNLEFLADDTVLQEGTDKKTYQYLLLKVTGYSPLQIVSSFKLSSLKQRIYMMNKTRTSQKHLLKLLFVLPLMAVMMLSFRNNDAPVSNAVHSNIKEETYMLDELTYNIADAKVDELVKQAQGKSLLQVGKPFTISVIKNERDRLKLLLEKNGYSNIGNHAISFLIDSSLVNNSFAVQVNIDLKRKTLSLNNTNKETGNAFADNRIAHLQTTHHEIAVTEQQENKL